MFRLFSLSFVMHRRLVVRPHTRTRIPYVLIFKFNTPKEKMRWLHQSLVTRRVRIALRFVSRMTNPIATNVSNFQGFSFKQHSPRPIFFRSIINVNKQSWVYFLASELTPVQNTTWKAIRFTQAVLVEECPDDCNVFSSISPS